MPLADALQGVPVFARSSSTLGPKTNGHVPSSVAEVFGQRGMVMLQLGFVVQKSRSNRRAEGVRAGF